MTLLLGLTTHTGARLAEVGFLLILIAGLFLATAQFTALRFHTARLVVAGALFTAAGVLLIVATHWAYFGVR